MGEILGKGSVEESLNKSIKPLMITIEDIPQILEISQSFWGKKGIYKSSSLEKVINQHLSFAYKIRGKLIAFCLMYYKENTNIVTVFLICVKKEYQGKHFGKSLLSHCIKNCQNHNFKNFDLHVSTTNVAAFAVYKKLGFVVKSFINNYYRDDNPKNNDAFYMTLNL